MIYMRVHAIDKLSQISTWDRVKIAVWNFILPPHLKFEIKEK